jgi:hypothetical protein
MDQVRVNMRAKVANSKIRREKRNGRDVIIVPSATLPFGIVMNRILYPGDVIERDYASLDSTPAPLGHPMAGSQYVAINAAKKDYAVWNQYYVGAWNENARIQNKRVLLDKVIDVEFTQAHPQGKKLMEAIDKQEPISTSTGLLLNMAPAQHEDYDWVVVSMLADHDAILIGTEPAAGVDQGVGIFVNAQGVEVPVQNLELDDDAIESIAQDIAWRLEHEAKEEKRKPLIEEIMKAIKGIFGGYKEQETNEGSALSVNKEGEDMELKELADKLEALTANMLTADAVKEMLAPVTAQVETLTANAKAAEAATHAMLVEKVVKANLLDEADAKDLSVNALAKLAAKIPETAASAGAFGKFAGNAADEMGFELPGGDA